MSLDQWEAEADQFYRDTGYMRPGKDDARHEHTYDERCAAFEVWWTMRKKIEALVADRRATPLAAPAPTGEGDGWIACSERMPEPRVQAWLLRHGRPIIGCLEPAEYALPDRWVGNGNTYWLDTGGVTHWSPLPAAPPSAGETT